MDYTNKALGLRVQTQIPLNVKKYKESEESLKDLGINNNLAFIYEQGLIVYCIQEGTRWEWKENIASEEGLLDSDFIYPDNTITFGIDYSNKKYNFFKIEYQNLSDVKVYDATSLGTGETIYKDKTVAGNNVTFNFKEVTTANVGSGIAVLSGASTSGDNVVISGKTLKTNNLSITEADGEITIDTPTDPSDIKCYVNENYSGGNSNGSLSKPYTSLKAAFDAYINTANGGTILAPQYANIGTIELLSNVTVPATGPNAMTYISVNRLKLKGNGFAINYAGTQDYFISTQYLMSLDAMTTSQKLDHDILMSFENVIIQSLTKHKMIYCLAYTSPIFSGSQNSANIEFKNCKFIDSAYTQDLAYYTDSGVDLFEQSVFVQNTLPKSQYLIKNENISWHGGGGLSMSDVEIVGSSSTMLYNLNSTLSCYNIIMNFNSYFANYKDTTGSVFNPMESIYYILNENTGVIGATNGYLRIENFKQTTQIANSGGERLGGCDAIFRVVGTTRLIIDGGSFYADRANNLLQLHNTTSFGTLRDLTAVELDIHDSTWGAFKYTGTIPGAPKYVDVSRSTINRVKNWTTLQFIRPTASSATINNAHFTVLPAYADDTAAKAAGLVPGNVYYDSTGQIATRVA